MINIDDIVRDIIFDTMEILEIYYISDDDMEVLEDAIRKRLVEYNVLKCMLN